MKPNRISLLLAACGTAALLAGVPASARSLHGAKHTVTQLTFVTSTTQAPAFAPLVANFNKDNSDVQINMQAVDITQIAQLVSTELAAGNGPDLIWAIPGAYFADGTQIFARAGRLADLSNRPWVGRLVSFAKDLQSYKGKVYGWMMDANPVTYDYNIDLMAKLGIKVPTTFAQLLSACQKSASQGVPFMAENATPTVLGSQIAGQWVQAVDPNWISKREKGTVTFAGSPVWENALRHVVALYRAGCYQSNPQATLTNGQRLAMVAQGKVVGVMGNPTYRNAIKALNPNINLGMAMMPGDTVAKTYLVTLATNGVDVNASSPNKAAAIKAVDFFARQGQDQLFATVAGTISARDLKLKKFPADWAPFASATSAGRIVNGASAYFINTSINTAFLQGIVGLWTGQVSIDQVLQNMDTAWDQGPS